MATSIAAIVMSTVLLAGVNDVPSQDDSIHQAMVRSCECEKNKDYANAIAVLAEQVKTHGDDYVLNLRLGWLNHLNGKPEDAIRYYQEAIKKSPKAVEAKLGCLLPMLASSKYNEAETLAKQVIKDDPGNYYGNLRLAVALRMQQKYREAYEIVKGMLAAYPADIYFSGEMALLNPIVGEPNDGGAGAPSKIDPQVSEAFRKSFQYEYDRKYPEAIKTISEQLSANPKDYTLNLRLGWLYNLNGDYKNAAHHYYTALQIAPRSIEAGIGYLLPLLSQARYSEAESFARQIIKGDPGNYYANLRLAVALRLQGKYAEAKEVVQPMLEAYPADVLFISEMALINVSQKKQDAAAALFYDVLSLDPENALAKQHFRGL
jgi:cytochrome c-type biogenesis protein CcmH/NrfG